MKRMLPLLLLLLLPGVAVAAEAPGKLDLPLWTATPFVLLLLSIALLPLFLGSWWHHHRSKATVTVLFILPVVAYLWIISPRTNGASIDQLLHELHQYVVFILLLGTLYTVAGGIVVEGAIRPSAPTNTLLLGLGAVLANVIGTTGASMVLIRPILRINLGRPRNSHIPLFFIFVVSNTGGVLTPIGDPPLFLGFLEGVDFFWTLGLWKQWLVVNGLALALFYLWDNRALHRDRAAGWKYQQPTHEPIRISGWKLNGALLVCVICLILLYAPVVGQKLGQLLGLGNVTLHSPWGEICLVLLSLISLRYTPRPLRERNGFAWGPIVEVAILFAGIFVTMVPALALLRERGAQLNIRQPWEFFWITGALSSFLDNAPTFKTLATLAAQGQDLKWLMQQMPDLLAAVCCGAVFMGANTYIGNGPNFMVKAIAEEASYRMPSFFGYMLYSCLILVPLFVLVTLLFFI